MQLRPNPSVAWRCRADRVARSLLRQGPCALRLDWLAKPSVASVTDCQAGQSHVPDWREQTLVNGLFGKEAVVWPAEKQRS